MPLRLKSLELHGYKTFAARTIFEFAGGITAIVGPNGAGKSNIADALRWVLGEQTYSLLRGKKTEDMIFSGSEHKPRAGMASAEIVFDNSTNWLPVDFADVAIARRAYRDGHNEYVLNGQHVRLRDMNELLAASGLSERTYTIVGQGLVDASLALKADDRRRLFEEAAGVGLYRVRREEALKRLESTKRNLERVRDIMAEVEPRLKTLERQARRAREFGASQDELRALLQEWYGYHWHRAQEQLEAAQSNVETLQGRADTLRDEYGKSQSATTKFRERLAGLRTQLGDWQRELSELQRQRESARRDLAVLDERQRSIVTSHVSLATEQERAEAEAQLARERLAEIDQESTRLRAESEQARREHDLAQAAFQERQSGRAAAEAELQAARNLMASLSAQRAETQARLDEVAARMASKTSKTEAAAQSLASTKLAVQAAADSRAGAFAKRERSGQSLEQALARFDAKKKDMSTLEEKRRADLDEMSKMQSSHARLSAQLEVLEQAEQSLAGYAEGARFLLEAARQSQLSVRGALSSVLDLPAELETAISAALGDTLDTVLLEDKEVDQALRLLESDDAGRAALLALNGGEPQQIGKPADAEVVGVASQLVQAPAELRSAVAILLGNTVVVKTREGARRLLPKIPASGRIVTLRGEVFRGDGVIIAGTSATSSTLSRPRQKREISASVAEVGSRIVRMQTLMDGSAADLDNAQIDMAALEAESSQIRAAGERDQAEEQQAEVELEKQHRVMEWQDSRLAELSKELAEAEQEKLRLSQTAAEIEVKADAARTDERTLSRQFNELSLDEAQGQAAYWSTRVAVLEQTLANVEARNLERQEGLAVAEKQIQDMQARLSETDASLIEFDRHKTTVGEKESDLDRQIEALQAKIRPTEEELESVEREESRLQGLEVTSQSGLTNVERALAQGQIELVRREEGLDSLRTRMIDDFGLVSFQYAESAEAAPAPPFEELVEELTAVPALKPEVEDRLTQQRARMRRLGLVNPEAAKDYESESQRYSFMSSQVEDLHKAEGDLQQVIEELDELTRQEFSRTYAAVDKQFRSIFTRLFGGGTAHLSLTDPDDLVETGIEVEARLPGRREQGLSLLSGGERSLTAIALIFALLKVSPTPVCVLDEVDAMLDEANVGRFRDLLSELSQETQFVVITHNRNTVQAADSIYGITMGRDSTSQVISLKLDEVSEEMLGATRA